MSKSSTFIISTLNPLAPRTPWLEDTYRLLNAYKADFVRQTGSRGAADAGASAILMASDLLYEVHGSAAHWEQLQLLALFARFPQFAALPGFCETAIHALGAFYCYLGKQGRVSSDKHRQMRQLSLDCATMGLERALEQHRIDLLAKSDTVPAMRIFKPSRAVH